MKFRIGLSVVLAFFVLGIVFLNVRYIRSDENLAASTCNAIGVAVKKWHQDFLSHKGDLPEMFPESVSELVDRGYLPLGFIGHYRGRIAVEYIPPTPGAGSQTMVVRGFAGYAVYEGFYGGSISSARK